MESSRRFKERALKRLKKVAQVSASLIFLWEGVSHHGVFIAFWGTPQERLNEIGWRTHRASHVNLQFENIWEKAVGISEEVVSTNIGTVAKKTKFPGYKTLTNMQKDCILGALEQNVATFAKHPQQWLTQWHLRMGWEMLQFEWVEERWEELFTEGNRVRLLSPSVIRV